jgi:hypothetical protein
VKDFIKKNDIYDHKLLPKSGVMDKIKHEEDNDKFAQTILKLVDDIISSAN